MVCKQAHLQAVCDHKHQALPLQLLGEVIRVPGEAEFFILYVLLVNGCRDQNVDISFF